MKIVQKFVTKDNKVFNTKNEAINHVDSLVSKVLYPLVDKIYRVNHRSEIAILIMNNLQTFEELIALTKDTLLEDNEDND